MKRYITVLLKCVVSLTIINVWLFRFDQATRYRGGDASDIFAEFTAYGLSLNMMYIVGAVKVLAALLLLVSIFYKKFEFAPLFTIAGLMTAAVYFHFSIGDALIKAFPAALMLLLCAVIYLLNTQEKAFA